jgi:hypothetical protein
MRRRFCIGSLTLVLLALIWFGKVHNPTVTLAMYLDDPAHYDGLLAEIGLEVTVMQTWPDSFRVKQMDETVTIVGSPDGAQPGDYVRLLGRFRAPGRLELERLYIARGRRAKIAWSIVPLLVLTGLWLRAYRFDFSGWYWQERS